MATTPPRPDAAGAPRVVARRRVHAGWNTFDVVTVEAADRHGRVRRLDREVIDHGEASAVLIVDTPRRTAFLVRQWRAPLVEAGGDPFLLEACAGIVDPGETPEDTARREAHEETGLTLGALRRVGCILTSPGTLTERTHLFIGEAGGGAAAGGGVDHEGEDIEVVEMPFDALFAAARAGTLADAKTLVLVQHLMLEEMAGTGILGR